MYDVLTNFSKNNGYESLEDYVFNNTTLPRGYYLFYDKDLNLIEEFEISEVKKVDHISNYKDISRLYSKSMCIDDNNKVVWSRLPTLTSNNLASLIINSKRVVEKEVETIYPYFDVLRENKMLNGFTKKFQKYFIEKNPEIDEEKTNKYYDFFANMIESGKLSELSKSAYEIDNKYKLVIIIDDEDYIETESKRYFSYRLVNISQAKLKDGILYSVPVINYTVNEDKPHLTKLGRLEHGHNMKTVEELYKDKIVNDALTLMTYTSKLANRFETFWINEDGDFYTMDNINEMSIKGTDLYEIRYTSDFALTVEPVTMINTFRELKEKIFAEYDDGIKEIKTMIQLIDYITSNLYDIHYPRGFRMKNSFESDLSEAYKKFKSSDCSSDYLLGHRNLTRLLTFARTSDHEGLLMESKRQALSLLNDTKFLFSQKSRKDKNDDATKRMNFVKRAKGLLRILELSGGRKLIDINELKEKVNEGTTQVYSQQETEILIGALIKMIEYSRGGSLDNNRAFGLNALKSMLNTKKYKGAQQNIIDLMLYGDFMSGTYKTTENAIAAVTAFSSEEVINRANIILGYVKGLDILINKKKEEEEDNE